MSYKTRDEDLFWKMIEAYCEIAPDGPLTNGIMYLGGDLSLICRRLSITVVVNGKGLKTDISVVYNSPEEDAKYREVVEDGFVYVEQFCLWEDFRLDDWLAWLVNYGDWDKVVAISSYSKSIGK